MGACALAWPIKSLLLSKMAIYTVLPYDYLQDTDRNACHEYGNRDRNKTDDSCLKASGLPAVQNVSLTGALD